MINSRISQQQDVNQKMIKEKDFEISNFRKRENRTQSISNHILIGNREIIDPSFNLCSLE